MPPIACLMQSIPSQVVPRASVFRQLSLIGGVCATMAVSLPISGQAGVWTPDPSLGNASQHLRLYELGRRSGDSHYDEAVGLVEKDPGRHKNYMIRESAYYAYGLLLTADPVDRQRAEKIIRVVLTKQDLNKQHSTYGWFPSLYEDQWDHPLNPDGNYCQFVGMALGDIIDLDRKQNRVLPEDLRQQLETAFRLAVEATIRRDIDPGYSNIAFLSAAVGAAGEKLLGIPGAGDFAINKLTWYLARARPDVSVREYLAPTYYGVDLDALYTAQHFAATPELASFTKRALDAIWREIALSYHAPTMQLSGPFSRAYGDNMLEYAAGLKYFLYIALDGKYPLAETETQHDWDVVGLNVTATLPTTVRPEFSQETHTPWREVKVMGTDGMAFRQYRAGDFILGSINEQTLWQQQRSVVAYWPVKQPTWHVGFCIDSSAMTFGNGSVQFRSTQSNNVVLAALMSKRPVPAKGGVQIGFDNGAQAQGLTGGPAGACVVRDGDVTTYIYPVTRRPNGQMTFKSDTDHNKVYVERSWAEADPGTKYDVLSYLVVFQLPGEPVPVVKNLSLNLADTGTSISAEINGKPLSLQVPN